MNLVGLCGSLRQDSTNGRLLQAAVTLCPSPARLTVSHLIQTLPLFSPDIDPSKNGPVSAWTKQIREADGLVISTPEYARGYPGALKNALDWLVQGDGFVNKPFMFLTASARASQSQITLTTVLETMSGQHVVEADIVVPLLGTQTSTAELVADDKYASQIHLAFQRFQQAVQKLAKQV